MSELLSAPISKWLQLSDEGELYKLEFAEHHLGNIWIRSLHGGVSGSMIELCAEAETKKTVGSDPQLTISSSSVDYLRITKDADMFARATIVRKSRRLSIVDVVCWQDDESVPVVRGTVTIKVDQ